MIVATGAEGILGIGDWGVGGIDIAIGKLVVCTAAAGINPARVIPVMLDVGTNRDSLLKDPLYIGNRHSRVRGEPYDHFIDEYVNTATRLFPNALLHWEDFGPWNARSILEKYRTRICTFNGDMQGTGAITLAAILSAISITHIPLREQRIVIFGSGTVGIGNADQIRSAMMIEGLPQDEATRNFWCIDIQGLLTTDMGNTLGDFQVPYARPTSEVATWQHDLPGGNQSILNYRVKREKHSDSAIMCTMLATSWSESVLSLSGSFYLNREEHHTLSVNLLIPSRLKRS